MLVYRSVVFLFQKFTWIIWNEESSPSIIYWVEWPCIKGKRVKWVSFGWLWTDASNFHPNKSHRGSFKLTGSKVKRQQTDIQVRWSCFLVFLFPVVLITCHPTIFTRKTRDVEHPASGLQALMVMGGMISSTTVARASWNGRKVGSCNGERLPLWRLFSNKNSDLML